MALIRLFGESVQQVGEDGYLLMFQHFLNGLKNRMEVSKMKLIKISESKIPAIEYDTIEDCLWDRSFENNRYLRNYKKPKNRYNGQFLFIYKHSPGVIILIRCTEEFMQYEILKFNRGKLLRDMGRDEISLGKKIVKAMDLIDNTERKNFTRNIFNKIVNLLSDAYKYRKNLETYNDSNIYDLISQLLQDENVRQYSYVKME